MSTTLGLDSFLRIGSITIAGYDFLITLPAEWRMYHSSGMLRFRWSVSRVLFILIRYVSIILLTVSNVGYFYHGFSAETCSTYFLVAPVLKVVQIMISQAIVGYRTWSIAKRSRDMGIFLLVFGFVITAVEWYANIDARIPVQKDGNCSPGNPKTRVPQWLFYLLAMLFDFTTILLSSSLLIKSTGKVCRMSSILKMLFYDGLGYVVILTGVNIMNLIMFRNSVGHAVQTSSASFGYTAVWIMSQNILIHIHEASEARARQIIFGPADVYNVRNANSGDGNNAKDLDVQVQIERTVMMDFDPRISQKQRVLWERARSDITNGDGSFVDQGQWELSNTIKTTGAV